MVNQSSNNPLVSICIPAYNAEPWVARCIESALAQTYSPTEIVVSDDSSTDGTVAIVRRYAKQGVRLIESTQNLGRAGNANRVIRASQGEIVVRLDADDLLYPNYLQELTPILITHSEVAFATCDFEIIDVSGQRLFMDRRVWPLGRQPGYQEFLRYLTGAKSKGTCLMIRRRHFEAVGGYDSRFIYADDWGLLLKLLTVGDVYYTNQVLASYRTHSIGKSASGLWNAKDRLLVAQLLPTLWPIELPGCEEHLKRVRRQLARRVIFSAVISPLADKSEIFDIVLKIDNSWTTRQMVILARTPLSPALTYPVQFRQKMARFTKHILLYLHGMVHY